MRPDNHSTDQNRHPLWPALSATAAAILFAVTGAIGYRLGKQERFVHGAWAGHVIWSEIAMGAAIGLVAVYFWSKGLRNAVPRQVTRRE